MPIPYDPTSAKTELTKLLDRAEEDLLNLKARRDKFNAAQDQEKAELDAQRTKIDTRIAMYEHLLRVVQGELP